MQLRPCVAPIKVGIFRLINNPQFDPIVENLKNALQKEDVVCKVDSTSGTVGRRYARSDEIGIPFGVTVDFQTLIDKSVTVRDRNTMSQIRVPGSALVSLLKDLSSESLDWETATKKYTVIRTCGDDEEGGETSVGASAVQGSALAVERNYRSSFSRPSVPIV
ncbi:unnamed protein product [Symbiodinium microadriaticum]|nr:unnamed protein product [Symbiodinium microadriaticum]